MGDSTDPRRTPRLSLITVSGPCMCRLEGTNDTGFVKMVEEDTKLHRIKGLLKGHRSTGILIGKKCCI